MEESREHIPLYENSRQTGGQLFDGTKDDQKKNRRSHGFCCQVIPKRYIIAVLAMLGFCNVYALRVNLSVALVAMVSNTTVIKDGKKTLEPPEFHWDTKLQGSVLAAFFYGYLITQFPGGLLARKFGGKNLFGLGVLCTALFTLLTPIAARQHVAVLIFLRILEGLCEGVVFPASHQVWSKWAPPLERSKLATIAVSGTHFGTVLAMPLSGVLAEQFGWPSIFYCFGTCGVLWAVLWFGVVKDSPEDDPKISPEELHYIQTSLAKDASSYKDVSRVPWKAIFTSLPVWAIIVAHFTENWGFYTMLTELPSYLKHRLHFDLSRAGFVSALPYLVIMITAQIGGNIADCLRRKKIMSTTNVRKLFNSLGFIAQGLCLVIAGYTRDWLTAVIALTFSVGIGGLAYSGFFVNHLDIAPPYAGILMGISNTVATLPGIFSPLITGFITVHQSAAEWRTVFFLAGSVYVFGLIFYVIFASGEKQDWANGYTVLELTEEETQQD